MPSWNKGEKGGGRHGNWIDYNPVKYAFRTAGADVLQRWKDKYGYVVPDACLKNAQGQGTPLLRMNEVIEWPVVQDTLTRRYTAEAIRFIKANRDKPFLLYLAHIMPHRPVSASKEFQGTSQSGIYGDALQELDWSLGEVLKTLKDLGLDENTLVIFTSDNGPRPPGSAGPLRGEKGQTYEGGMREPAIMRWPGHIPAGRTCSEVAGTIDILPTLAALAGAKTPADRVIDGKNIWPLMGCEPGARSPHDAFYYFLGGRAEAVRAGNWKLRRAFDRQTGQSGPVELYDLASDVGESNNLAAQYLDMVARMTEMMAKFERELQATREKEVRKPGAGMP